jgi:hypothetical protein
LHNPVQDYAGDFEPGSIVTRKSLGSEPGLVAARVFHVELSIGLSQVNDSFHDANDGEDNTCNSAR